MDCSTTFVVAELARQQATKDEIFTERPQIQVAKVDCDVLDRYRFPATIAGGECGTADCETRGYPS